MTAPLTDHLGHYEGTGTWRDTTGTHHAYGVRLTLEARGEALGLSFRHVFHEEAGQPDVTLDLTLMPTALASSPSISAGSRGAATGRRHRRAFRPS
ncbi:MAG: hypothetical protein R3D59_12080 [Paracoccaceae bacterium]